MHLFYLRVRSRNQGAISGAYTIETMNGDSACRSVLHLEGIDGHTVTCQPELWSTAEAHVVQGDPEYPRPKHLPGR
jgi:hypothetical protein